jgi:hypothetical protein
MQNKGRASQYRGPAFFNLDESSNTLEIKFLLALFLEKFPEKFYKLLNIRKLNFYSVQKVFQNDFFMKKSGKMVCDFK